MRLKWIYEERSAISCRAGFIPEPPDPEIAALGKSLRDEIIEAYQNRHQDRPYRFLFHMPPDGVGVVWFRDLMQILEHTGIQCVSVRAGDPAFRQTWEAFRPNVFVSIDVPYMLKGIDLDYVQQYKRAHGCFRLLTPYPKYRFPDRGMSADDAWRLELARSGKTADAFFSMYVKDFFSMFLPEWANAGFEYLELPHGCNPLYQYPREEPKEFDFFLATSYGPERLRMTWDYMRPVFERYHGLWAGPGWGFGLGYLENEKLPGYYARAKIIPNQMGSYLRSFPMEISERAFSCLACGAFQITDWTPVTRNFFSAEELVQVHGRREFLEAFSFYVNHPKERNETVKKGMRRVFAEHSYFHRIDNLITFLDGNANRF